MRLVGAYANARLVHAERHTYAGRLLFGQPNSIAQLLQIEQQLVVLLLDLAPPVLGRTGELIAVPNVYSRLLDQFGQILNAGRTAVLQTLQFRQQLVSYLELVLVDQLVNLLETCQNIVEMIAAIACLLIEADRQTFQFLNDQLHFAFTVLQFAGNFVNQKHLLVQFTL